MADDSAVLHTLGGKPVYTGLALLDRIGEMQ